MVWEVTTTYEESIKTIAMDLKELATPANSDLDHELLTIANRLFELAGDDIIMECDICGDYHNKDSVPLSCATGDGE